ncbi:hypothetical protein [Persephonella sp.]
MGKVIIETKDGKEVKLKTSLTTAQIQEIIDRAEKKERMKRLINKTFGTLKEDKKLEKKLNIQWYEQ